MTSEVTIEVGVNVGISREQAERCLRLLEMFLDDNQGVSIDCEKKTHFENDKSYIKHYLHFSKERL